MLNARTCKHSNENEGELNQCAEIISCIIESVEEFVFAEKWREYVALKRSPFKCIVHCIEKAIN